MSTHDSSAHPSRKVLPEERAPRDAGKEWRAVVGLAAGGLATAVHHFLVLFHEAEAIDLLTYCLIAEEVGIADARHADGTEHLAADDFDVLVVDGNRLKNCPPPSNNYRAERTWKLTDSKRLSLSSLEASGKPKA